MKSEEGIPWLQKYTNFIQNYLNLISKNQFKTKILTLTLKFC